MDQEVECQFCHKRWKPRGSRLPVKCAGCFRVRWLLESPVQEGRVNGAPAPGFVSSGRSLGDLPIYVERLFNLTPDYYISLSSDQRRDLIRLMELSLGFVPSTAGVKSNVP